MFYYNYLKFFKFRISYFANLFYYYFNNKLYEDFIVKDFFNIYNY